MFKKKSASCSFKKVTTKHFLAKLLCLLLIINLLTISTPAAPRVIIGVVGEVSQDIRFGFLSGSWAIKFPDWVGGFFLPTRNSPNNRQISRIEIFPGSITVAQGERVTFSAIDFDAQDEPVSGGINVRWRVADTGRGLRERRLRDGKFEARVIGTFTITAESRGQQAQVTVTVTPSVAGRSNQPDPETITPINISSRSTTRVSNERVKETSEKTSQESPSPLLPDDGDWGDENWIRWMTPAIYREIRREIRWMTAREAGIFNSPHRLSPCPDAV